VVLLVTACQFRPGASHDAAGDDHDDDDGGARPLDAPPGSEPLPPMARCLADATYAPISGSAHSYKLTSQSYDFDTAFDTCAADGAHLAAIHDTGENQLVFDHAKEAWFGLDDLRTEGGFHWADGTQLDFTSWDTNEPSNAFNNEDCAYMTSNNGTWNDTACNNSRRALCECEAGYQPPAPRACRTMTGANIQNGRRYFVRTVAVSWTAARDDCASIGAYLMVPTDDTENALVEHSLNLGVDGWIGLAADAVVANQWDWINGAPYVYTKWAGGAPQNGAGRACVVVHKSDDLWENLACATPHPYVCECDPGEP
jgi:hypothetical protein